MNKLKKKNGKYKSINMETINALSEGGETALIIGIAVIIVAVICFMGCIITSMICCNPCHICCLRTSGAKAEVNEESAVIFC